MRSWWSIGKFGGVPVRIHWSALLGAVFFSGFRLAPGAWLGFALVILVHELGHAVLVRRTGQRLHGIDVHGLGGECRWSGHATPIQRAAIAWGGVWAQLALFFVAFPISWMVGGSWGGFGRDLFYALTWSSLWLAALNLVPVRPLDGAEAWMLPKLVWERIQRRRLQRAQRPEPFPPPRVRVPEPARPAVVDDELSRIFSKIASDARDARTKR